MSEEPSAGVQSWVVTVASADSLPTVVLELRHIGFTIESVFDAIGSVIARGNEDQARKARLIPGVTDVSKEVMFDIGGPGEEVS